MPHEAQARHEDRLKTPHDGRSHTSRDRQQALRITRNLMAAGTSALVIMLLGIYRLEGYIDPVPFIVASALIVALVIAFYVAFHTNFNLRFADPSLTMAQVASAVAVLVYVNLNLHDGRGAFLLVYIMAMLFGVFRMTTRQLLVIVVPVIAAHAAFIAARMDAGSATLQIELLHWMVLTVVLLWFAQLGGYISIMRRRLRTLSTLDELTGAFSRRHVIELLDVEKARADRHSEPFCVALIDLDRFKAINDAHGHATGDEVLKAFARTVRDTIRTSDHFGRYGGEEFALILPRTSLDPALPVMERIRAATSGNPWSAIVADLAVTVSIGIAEYRRGESADLLVQRADAALYDAKRAGRDRVVSRK